jgi:hypothetical protein
MATKIQSYDVSGGNTFLVSQRIKESTVAIQMNFKNLDAFDGTVKLMQSVDGDVYMEVADASLTVTANDSILLANTDHVGEWVGVEYNVGSATVGVVDVHLSAKDK